MKIMAKKLFLVMAAFVFASGISFAKSWNIDISEKAIYVKLEPAYPWENGVQNKNAAPYGYQCVLDITELFPKGDLPQKEDKIRVAWRTASDIDIAQLMFRIVENTAAVNWWKELTEPIFFDNVKSGRVNDFDFNFTFNSKAIEGVSFVIFCSIDAAKGPCTFKTADKTTQTAIANAKKDTDITSSSKTSSEYMKSAKRKVPGSYEYLGWTYTIENDNTVIIHDYKHTKEKLDIPDTIRNMLVTKIGEYAFYECEILKSVKIPKTVVRIGDGAFSFCENLESVMIPDGVAYIGDEAFSFCDSLKSVTIPESVEYIGDEAFSWCEELESVTILNDEIEIGMDAFADCDDLVIKASEDSNAIIYAEENAIGYGIVSGGALKKKYEEKLKDAQKKTKTAEQKSKSAEEKAKAAEEKAKAAEEKLKAAEEKVRETEEKLKAAEEKAKAAEEKAKKATIQKPTATLTKFLDDYAAGKPVNAGTIITDLSIPEKKVKATSVMSEKNWKEINDAIDKKEYDDYLAWTEGEYTGYYPYNFLRSDSIQRIELKGIGEAYIVFYVSGVRASGDRVVEAEFCAVIAKKNGKFVCLDYSIPYNPFTYTFHIGDHDHGDVIYEKFYTTNGTTFAYYDYGLFGKVVEMECKNGKVVLEKTVVEFDKTFKETPSLKGILTKDAFAKSQKLVYFYHSPYRYYEFGYIENTEEYKENGKVIASLIFNGLGIEDEANFPEDFAIKLTNQSGKKVDVKGSGYCFYNENGPKVILKVFKENEKSEDFKYDYENPMDATYTIYDLKTLNKIYDGKIETVATVTSVTNKVGTYKDFSYELCEIFKDNDVKNIAKITKTTSKKQEIDIPSKIEGFDVAVIGENAFYNCKNLKSVTIPNGVTKIEKKAFQWCESLISVAIPKSVTEIGEYAFDCCSDNLVIKAKSGSYAIKYAKENDLKYKAE